MVKTNRDYVIPFVGLKLGVHEFDFEVTDKFFEEFEYSIVQSGDVNVHLTLDKKETMLVGDFTLNGNVKAMCDRCNDPVEVKIEGNYQLVFKFDDKPSDDEALVIVYPEEFELDLNDHLLELINVSLPPRTVHEIDECNEEMIDLLDEYSFYSEEEDELEEGEDEADNEDDIDPRWNALKDLK